MFKTLRLSLASLWLTLLLSGHSAAGQQQGLPVDVSLAPRHLSIYSATDLSAIEPVINGFRQRYPLIAVDYLEYQTNALYQQIEDSYRKDPYAPDLVISSAMDLQTKLVNDGLAQPYRSAYTDSLPEWANWRDEAFGFTFEPVVMVYNKAAFAEQPLPQSHEELAEQLRAHPDFYRSRVGTYDVRTSGVGYLLATQDAVHSSLNGRLLESLGRAMTRTYCCTGNILDEIASGQLVLGYNLLGSYALARAQEDPRIGVILPQDYTLVMSRVAFIPKKARSPQAAKLFLDYLLSPEGQQLIAAHSGLVAIHPQAQGELSITTLREHHPSGFQPIALGPALLVYLDQMKRLRFLREWQGALLPSMP
ncbi:ABC transporter substrate-binding protein [Balneatrix alpica]|uniref:ABC transporter substrate-binding protein n=1 Tax=Balneatrix alpica TaxID=75684 RepID=UPI0027393AD3|nr:ABC transporter substrate-binding protein [Balneatrix alpica]